MRKICLIALSVLFCILLNAENLYYPISLRLNSINGIYSKNEPVYVYADISDTSKKDLLYTVKVNGHIKENKVLPVNKLLIHSRACLHYRK